MDFALVEIGWLAAYGCQANGFDANNSVRLHSKLSNLSLNAFERESTLKKSIDLSEIT